jgi:hypothetical protein
LPHGYLLGLPAMPLCGEYLIRQVDNQLTPR